MKYIYQEETPERAPYILPYVQLLIYTPAITRFEGQRLVIPYLTAGTIAKGCEGRRTPLLIFDLAPTTSVEELAGLLPAVCLYTPEDLRRILCKTAMKAS
ncbi:hypothetical protein KDH_52160 [Dictyobacter sp. S3.2.2.5]|uniref:Uncharacterized protein n=2 Tax=Dictyobacter halimunensis TaxID=3026934 RepID=A0ABQ6G158_9CHLR|nr:hypothetical protein KDH_52160 [Dictyobacter sp. S3.2.2.5]